jgi:hypothetical protein
MPVLRFDEKEGITKIKIRAQSDHIGWLTTLADQPGARFDLEIKDSLGRSVLRKENCGNDTAQYGELINHPTQLGEELEICIDNLRNAQKIDLSLN